MMKTFTKTTTYLTRWLTVVLLAFAILPACAQQLSDKEILEYAAKRQKAGAESGTILKELNAKGISNAQILRIQRSFQRGKAQTPDLQPPTAGELDEKSLRLNNGETPDAAADAAEWPAAQTFSPHEAPPIFGHDIFRSQMLSFEPHANVAVRDDYVLGPGDELHVEVYGTSQYSSKQLISPEGDITLKYIGPIALAGKTLGEARRLVSTRLAAHYAGCNVRLSVGQTRTIGIHIMGEVAVPGSYTLSAFATVFHALYMAGGVADIGTLRAIKVVRGGHIVANVDIYDYILNGRLTGNILLHDGDVILVGPYEQLVEIRGRVKRPMRYEMRAGETLLNLLDAAGSFAKGAHQGSLRVERRIDTQRMVFNPAADEFATFLLTDGDIITADSSATHTVNMAKVEGAVVRPGSYELTADVADIRTLIGQAGGLTPDAQREHAVIIRKRADGNHEALGVALDDILTGTTPDVPLRTDDVLHIASRQARLNERYLLIDGDVFAPGKYPFADNMTVADLITLSGGLKEGASTTEIEVARHHMDAPEDSDGTNVQLFKVSLSPDSSSAAIAASDLALQPFDEVFIRRKPEYAPQSSIKVHGEVNYTGRYVLTKQEERLSDIIKRAGGLTLRASMNDARLLRRCTEEEVLRRRIIRERSRLSSDSITIDTLDTSNTYHVAIDLRTAIEHPGCCDDLILRDGDELFIPQHANTVTVSGEVLHPNTVTFTEGKSLDYYINQAGGYNTRAHSRKTFIIYNNGHVSRAKKGKVMPGCEIVVPTRHRRDANKNMTTGLSVTTAIATIAAILITALK